MTQFNDQNQEQNNSPFEPMHQNQTKSAFDQPQNQSAFDQQPNNSAFDQSNTAQPQSKEAASKEKFSAEEVQSMVSPDTFEKFKLQQNMLMGVLGGLAVGIVGALLWALIAVATNYRIGYMAIAIGAGVGFTFRKMGKGITPGFGIASAAISLLSVLLGNVLTIIFFMASHRGVSYVDAITYFDFDTLSELFMYDFSVIDILFYGLAVVEGYKFAFRVFTKQEIDEASRR